MARELTHVVSFRVTAAEYRELARLRATCGTQWGETFRWLLRDGDVRKVIEQRLNEASPAGADGMWGGGIEASLPRGDR